MSLRAIGEGHIVVHRVPLGRRRRRRRRAPRRSHRLRRRPASARPARAPDGVLRRQAGGPGERQRAGRTDPRRPAGPRSRSTTSSRDRRARPTTASSRRSPARPRACCTGWRRRTTGLVPHIDRALRACDLPERARPRATGWRTPASSGSSTTTAAVTYYATYTAFDGHQILPQLIETADFTDFEVTTLARPAADEQGHRHLPAEDRRALRRARPPRQREQLPDDVGRRPGLGRGQLIQEPERPWELCSSATAGHRSRPRRGGS